MNTPSSDKFIYGIYDNRGASLFTRVNDFFIDHGKVSLKEKAYFYELLAVMIDAGIPLLKTLKILADKTGNERFRRILYTVIYNIEHGDNLSTALGKFPMVFAETERGMIQSGELTGSLNVVLEKLAEDMNKTLDLHLKIRQAMMYPLTILVTLLLALVIILGIVIPPLKNLFESIGATVPTSLTVLMAVNGFLQQNYIWVLCGALLLLYGFISYIKTENGKLKWDQFRLSLPVVKDILKKLILVRFARSLGTLLESGVPLIKGLKTTGMALGNEVYRLAIDAVIGHVQQGKRISESLETYPDLFPEDLTQMIAVGERTATIPTATRKIAYQYEREIDHTLKNLTGVIEPIAIVAVGIVVGWFAFVILGSIFSISENIG